MSYSTRATWVKFVVKTDNYYRPQQSCGQGNIFTPVCHSVHRGWGGCYPSMHYRRYPSMPCSRSPGRGEGVCYPSMHCRWYPSMPCSRSVRGVVLSQHALQVVSQHALQQVSGGCLVWGGAWSRGWPSGVAFWCGGLLVESGLLVWWPSG